MPTTISTSTASTATAYSNQRKIDRCQNGNLWEFHWSGSMTSTQVLARYSTDNGATWSSAGSDFGFASTTQNFTPNYSIFIDLDDYCHVVFKDANDGRIYYRRGTPNTGRTSWTWSSALLASSSTSDDYPDVVAHREGTGWAVHVVGTQVFGGSNFTWYSPITITSGSVITKGTTVILDGGAGYGNSTPTFPSIDFNHTLGTKAVAGGTPHLYVGWSAGATGAGKGIRFRKATYSAGAWTWGTEREIDSTQKVPSDAFNLDCLFDGTRVILGGQVHDGTNYNVRLYDRDAADTTTTPYSLISGYTASTALIYGSLTYDGDGNVYFFGRNADEAAGTYDLVYRKWTRSTATLGPEVVIDSGVGDPWVSAKRGYSNSRIEYVYTDGTASPFNVVYDSVLLSFPQTLSPSAIASSFASGAITLAKTISVVPSGAASSFAAGTPNIMNLGVISPSGIASQFASGTPAIVTGPVTIMPSAIASSASLGSPNVAQNQIVEPAAIGSSFLAGEPSIHTLVQLLATSIASSFEAGGVTLALGEVRLLVSAILSSFGVGIPFVAPPSEFYDAAAYEEDDVTIADERLIVVRQPFLKLIET